MGASEYIPFHRPAIGQEEIDAVSEVLRSGWLSTGPKTLDFERAFAEYLGCKFAIAVNSCTAALHLALDAIGLKAGEEVIIPTNTFTATAEVVSYFGARVVFADTLPNGFNIDAASAASKVTARTRAIIPVHLAGEPCRMDELRSLAQKHGLSIIEDAAHAFPASYRGQRVGTLSPLTAFSFYATKTLTTGEGGMLTCNDPNLARRAQTMRLHGISRDAWTRYSERGSWFYEVMEAGFHYNMTDLQAALGLCQLRKADEFHKMRQSCVARYRELLSDVEEIELPEVPDDVEHAWHLFIIRLRLEKLQLNRDECIDYLDRAGIGTSVHFIPLHLQPYYMRTSGCRRGDCPSAERTYERSISLPLYPGLQEAGIDRVGNTLRRIIAENRKTLISHATRI